MEVLSTSAFWIGVVKIVWIDIILSGDNAVVIALAARSLPPALQNKAIVFGTSAAVVQRVLLTVVAAKLLQLPWLEIVGGLLLLWIGIQLLDEEEDNDGGKDKGQGGMFAAVRTILVADLVMSLDNIIAVAAASDGNTVLLILGLAISIPLVVFGSQMMIKLMRRFPIIITLGAALIGWVAGETVAKDAALAGIVAERHWLMYAAGVVGVVLVLVIGKARVARAAARRAAGTV